MEIPQENQKITEIPKKTPKLETLKRTKDVNIYEIRAQYLTVMARQMRMLLEKSYDEILNKNENDTLFKLAKYFDELIDKNEKELESLPEEELKAILAKHKTKAI